MNPIALAENSPACPRSAEGDLVLPNGTPWCRQLLMLLFTTKVLNEANSLLKPGAWAPLLGARAVCVLPLRGWAGGRHAAGGAAALLARCSTRGLCVREEEAAARMQPCLTKEPRALPPSSLQARARRRRRACSSSWA